MKNGYLIYHEQRYALEDNKQLERFAAYNIEKDTTKLSVGVAEDRYKHGKLGAIKLEFSFRY